MVHMNQNRIIEYELLLKLVKNKSHGRALAKELKIPLTTLQRALKRLSLILEIKIEGKNKIYKIKNNLKAKKYLHNAENYHLLKTIKKYPLLEPILEEIKTNTLTILFGSYAKHTANKDSDIDIYIETNNKELKKQIELINSKINVKIGTFNPKSLLIKEIIKNHVIIKGVEKYYEHIFE